MRSAMKTLSRAVLTAVLALSLLSVVALRVFPAHATEVDYAKVGWWSITYREVDNLNGCFAAAEFTDQTNIQVGLLQSNTEKAWTILISNPKWKDWIDNKTQVSLWLVTTKTWQGTFDVSDDKNSLILEQASNDFVNSLAGSRSLTIMNEDKQLLTQSPLNMKDSDPAIKTVVECVQRHPPISAPAPQAKQGTISGTAFFIAANVLLTNNHVVRECTTPVQARYPDQASHEATLAGDDGVNDLALLHTDLSAAATASFRFRPQLGEQIAVYGFPYPGVLSSSGNFTLGNVTSLSGMEDDSRFLQISAPVQPGNSGGPLLDMSGNVLGVVVSQLNALAMMKGAESVPQNVNFAIQIPIVINFLSTKGVKAKLQTPGSTAKTLSPTEVADLAKQFTVQVYCQGNVSESSTTGGSAVAARSDIMAVADKLNADPPREKAGLLRRVSASAMRRLLDGGWQQIGRAADK